MFSTHRCIRHFCPDDINRSLFDFLDVVDNLRHQRLGDDLAPDPLVLPNKQGFVPGIVRGVFDSNRFQLVFGNLDAGGLEER